MALLASYRLRSFGAQGRSFMLLTRPFYSALGTALGVPGKAMDWGGGSGF